MADLHAFCLRGSRQCDMSPVWCKVSQATPDFCFNSAETDRYYGNKVLQMPSLRQCNHEGCGFQGSGGLLR